MEEDKWFLSYLSHTQMGAHTCLKAAGRYRQASSPEHLRLCMENVQVWPAGEGDNENQIPSSRSAGFHLSLKNKSLRVFHLWHTSDTQI